MESHPPMTIRADATGRHRKRGNRLGFWFFKATIRLFGLRGAYGLVHLVCLHYLFFDRQSVEATMAYIRRRFPGRGYMARILGVYRILVNQGKSLVDRYYLISGLGTFEYEVQGYDEIKRILKDSDKGLVLLTAHVGNWQVTMNSLGRLDNTVRLLMRPEDNAAVKETLDVYPHGDKVKTISTASFMGGMIECAKALDNGELVSIMGDRIYGADWTTARILGAEARFPHAAFTLAAATERPVVVVLSGKISTKKYSVDLSHIIRTRYTSRKDRQKDIEKWVQEYATILEEYSGEYPYQWYLFHDIWAGAERQAPPPGHGGDGS